MDLRVNVRRFSNRKKLVKIIFYLEFGSSIFLRNVVPTYKTTRWQHIPEGTYMITLNLLKIFDSDVMHLQDTNTKTLRHPRTWKECRNAGKPNSPE